MVIHAVNGMMIILKLVDNMTLQISLLLISVALVAVVNALMMTPLETLLVTHALSIMMIIHRVVEAMTK